VSAIPAESRAAATAATATMLTEGFDELPALMASWRAEGSDVSRQAALYGRTLGDRTLTAVRTFEQHPPAPHTADPHREQTATAGQDRVHAAAAFAADPAIPPLRKIHGAAEPTRRPGELPAAAPTSRNGRGEAPSR